MVSPDIKHGPEKISWGQHLSPLWHKLIGSTPPNMSIAEVNALIGKANDGEGYAIRKLLRPIALGEGVSRSLVEKAREGRREIGANNIFATREYHADSFPLKGYTCYMRMGKLSDQDLEEGFDVEFVRGQEDRPAVLSEDVMFSLLEMLAKKRTEEQNTLYQLLTKGKIEASFSTEAISEKDKRLKTVMHFRYNFNIETSKGERPPMVVREREALGKIFSRFLKPEVEGQPKRVLSVGCGFGYESGPTVDMFPGASYRGIDILENVLEAARVNNNDLRNTEFQLGDARDKKTFGQEPWDIVLMRHPQILSSPQDWQKIIENSMEFVKPGGTLFVSTVEPEERDQVLEYIKFGKGMTVVVDKANDRDDRERIFPDRFIIIAKKTGASNADLLSPVSKTT